MAQAYEETLSESIARCHHSWNPEVDPDPLESFGIEEGALRGLTLTQTMPFRDIIIQWTEPHQSLNWPSLEDYTQMLCAIKLSPKDVELMADNGGTYYSLRYTILIHTYEVTLGITQIISTMDQLLARSVRRSFNIDKGYVILKQLALGDDSDYIQLSFYTLQNRCKGAVNHIRQTLNYIKALFGKYSNALTNHSYNSTLSDIRLNYGHLPPRLEVARHIQREDYQVNLPEHLRGYKDILVEEWVKSGRMVNPHPYQRKAAFYPRLVENEISDPPQVWSRTQGSLLKAARSQDQSQPSVFRSVSSRDRRCHAPPPSISVALSRNHPLSHFPALNSNVRNDYEQEREDSDPQNPWTQVRSTRSKNRSTSHNTSKYARFVNSREEEPSMEQTGPVNPFSRTILEESRSNPKPSSGGPPGGGPPDGDGPSGGGPGRPLRPYGSPKLGESQYASFPERRRIKGHGSPGGDPPGGGSDYGLDPEEKGATNGQSKGEWQLNNKINIGTIPQWNGDPTTMIDYIMEIALIARLSKRIFQEIGQIAPIRWTGAAKNWWMTLPLADQSYFSQDWECLMIGMREHFMNDGWLNDRGIEFDSMRFRRGNKNIRETPEEYFNRQIRLHMVLHPEEVDGPTVTHRLMNRQPILWGSILNTTACPSIVQLIKLAKAMEANLVAQYYNGLRVEKAKVVNTAAISLAEEKSEGEDELDEQKEAHAVTRGKPRKRTDWPKGRTIDGYSYSRDDSIVSKVAPPGPCFICLSPKHFFRECPHNAMFFGKSAHLADFVVDAEELREMDLEYYNHVSAVNSTLSEYVPPEDKAALVCATEVLDRRNRNERRREKFEMQANRKGKQKEEERPMENRAARRKRKVEKITVSSSIAQIDDNPLSPSVVHKELEEDLFSDEEDIADYPELSNEEETIQESSDTESTESSTDSSASSTIPLPSTSALEAESRKVTIEEELDPEAPPLASTSHNKEVKTGPKDWIPVEDEVVMAVKKETKPDGLSSLGSQALHIRAHVQSIGRGEVKARLDSGADITLMSEEFWEKMGTLMKPKEGMRMKLYHLTGHAKVLGYVKTRLYTKTTDNSWIGFELEAYVVRGMRVPLLLGEDFQTAYELNVKRYATGHCEVSVGSSPKIIPASSTHIVDLGFELRQAYLAQSFVKAKTARRSRARRLKNLPKDLPSVFAAEDVRIEAGTVKYIKVSSAFKGRKDWLVERVIVGLETSDVLAAPFTWITSDNPILPMANPGERPLYIREGEIVGKLADPSLYLDNPDESSSAKYVASAETIKAIIMGSLKDQDLASTSGPPPVVSDSKLEDEETWGPKTTAVPEEPSSGPVSELVTLGPDIPPEILPKLEEVLQRNARAFGVDGRLGHVDAKVSIPLRPGAQPVSLPMYGASPAKREVIDQQVKAWFEAGVIEPSVSPWGFPVVVVYRNGKARLAVDYRKLNAHTIPDEFPIPRQSEIIQALSGSQVLSSFDALAGFTQLEIQEEDRDKTAFRCHLGLWQFRRMPFGLRNGPSIFQRLMQGILAPYLWLFTLVYIDDIVVFSKSWEDHLVHLDKVLGAIANAGVTLSPPKCFIGFSSILLLGQKVSRLGLSTHQEKVQAILELNRPANVSDLQKFLGMVVYFSQYIPYYSFIAAPLFGLLKKGVKWRWEAEHEIAFQEAKQALSKAPVLGHPIQGQPYRLYTDASDIALGACLQQVQPIAVGDLKGTPVYERLSKAWQMGASVPVLYHSFATNTDENPEEDKWGNSLDETIIHVERVIAYWSRSLKAAERNYSTTEREALGAKEALVKFQPFIEGEIITLITDHAALQWARVYENANRRLAAWGAVFAAYPGLKIVHRPGRVHSNVDPLSRLPRIPQHNSPIRDDITPISADEEKRQVAQEAEDRMGSSSARKAAFAVWWWEDVIDRQSCAVQTRTQEIKDSLPSAFPEVDNWSYPSDAKLTNQGAGWEERAHLLVALDAEVVEKFVQGYQEDPFFKQYYADEIPNPRIAITPSHFRKGSNGLLYFIDARWDTRLCVPKSQVQFVLEWIHESPHEAAHGGYIKTLERMRELFFWKGMNRSMERFCETCDVCQKTKVDRTKKMGALRPSHIPSRPFETISLDLITGLPPSGDERYTAILVIVDKLTKFALFIPTHDTLSQEGFAKVFVERVVHVYGMPHRIIADRDRRWASGFWKSVVALHGSKMALSSSHHPQTDGQTEILNAFIEQMLRAYVSKDRSKWSDWLSILAFAYNSAKHSSTEDTPNGLLLHYHPKVSTGELLAPEFVSGPFNPSHQGEEYVRIVELRREQARDALVLAQERQARAFNKNRRPVEEINAGDFVLVNPHTLKLVEVEGTGRKLVQRMIGPFEVMEHINPNVYRLRLPDSYPMHPVINIEHLKKYKSSPAEFEKRTALPPTRDFLGSEEYEVEAILGHKLLGKKRGNHRLFRVRWVGYGPEADSWVSEADLRNSPEIKREYLTKLGLN